MAFAVDDRERTHVSGPHALGRLLLRVGNRLTDCGAGYRVPVLPSALFWERASFASRTPELTYIGQLRPCVRRLPSETEIATTYAARVPGYRCAPEAVAEGRPVRGGVPRCGRSRRSCPSSRSTAASIARASGRAGERALMKTAHSLENRRPMKG